MHSGTLHIHKFNYLLNYNNYQLNKGDDPDKLLYCYTYSFEIKLINMVDLIPN